MSDFARAASELKAGPCVADKVVGVVEAGVRTWLIAHSAESCGQVVSKLGSIAVEAARGAVAAHGAVALAKSFEGNCCWKDVWITGFDRTRQAAEAYKAQGDAGKSQSSKPLERRDCIHFGGVSGTDQGRTAQKTVQPGPANSI